MRHSQRICDPGVRAALAAIMLMVSSSSLAVIELNQFSSEEIRIRYQALIGELRCPKCQNQNLAESDSTVSVDLRRQVLLMLEEGHSDDDIRRFMRERYGDFILYKPPVEGKTLLVWILPALLFLLGLLAVVLIVRAASGRCANGATAIPGHEAGDHDSRETHSS